MNEYQLLAEVFKLIGETDEGALRSALQQKLSPEIRAVVEALSRAHKTMSAQRQPNPNVLVPTTSPPRLPSVTPPRNGELSTQFRALIEAAHLSRDDLMRVLQRRGISLERRSKESTRSVQSKAVSGFRRLPPARQAKVLRDLASDLKVDQTEGWLSVIGSRN